jgi:hypothetical protein
MYGSGYGGQTLIPISLLTFGCLIWGTPRLKVSITGLLNRVTTKVIRRLNAFLSRSVSGILQRRCYGETGMLRSDIWATCRMWLVSCVCSSTLVVYTFNLRSYSIHVQSDSSLWTGSVSQRVFSLSHQTVTSADRAVITTKFGME